MPKRTDSRPFHFKQFSLTHHRSTMKVGTDAVLLSAWVDLENVNTALDVGTGSGIIALMLAARDVEKVDAVELDEPSAKEAAENFKNSPFREKLKIHHQDFTTFSEIHEQKAYDLIISNPPFFLNDMRPADTQRKQARHTDSLTYIDLLTGSSKLLKDTGIFSVVLPYQQSRLFMEQAARLGFYIKRELLIFPKPCMEPNRVNLELSKEKPSKPLTEKFIIRQESGHFTDRYIDLLGRYYLSIKQ
jgi:tRNA1Val (adenine37-N6)-methyltransferase